MKYSGQLKAYWADVRIAVGQVYKFIVDGNYRACKDSETTFVSPDLLNSLGCFRKREQHISD